MLLRHLLGALVLTTCFVVPGRAAALRCGNELIAPGDTEYRVRTHCPEPMDAHRRVERRSSLLQVGGQLVGSDQIRVIDTWVLNFGPRRLMQRIELIDGVVQRIVSLGYGHRVDERGMWPRLGDSPGRVEAAWGTPADRIERTEVRSSGVAGRRAATSITTEVQLEIWLYDFGPDRLMRRLTFVDGRLERIETLGYGETR